MMVSMSLSPAAVSLLALLVAALALTWNIVSWRRSGPKLWLDTFFGVFRPENELPEDAESIHFQIIRVINGGRAPADIVHWGVRFLAHRGVRGRIRRTKVVDFTGKLSAPPHLPLRLESSSEVRLHSCPIVRFVELADAAGSGENV